MSMDWLSELTSDGGDEMHMPALHVIDPGAWLLEQVEEDKDHCFVCTGEDTYAAVAQKKSTLAQVEVKLDDEGYVCVSANAGVRVDEDTEVPFRMLQMSENATFKTMGYIPAKAGEMVTFRVRTRPSDEVNLSAIIDHCVHSTTSQAPEFEKIRRGTPVREVHDSIRSGHLRTAMRLRELMG